MGTEDIDLIKKPDFLTSEELHDLQARKLHDLLTRWAVFSNSNLGNIDDPVMALRKLPFTTKNDLRNTSPLVRCTVPITAVKYFFSSSGTSGSPTIYAWSQKDDEVLCIAGKRAMNRVSLVPEDIVLLLAPMGMPIMWYCMFKQVETVGAALIPLGAQPSAEVGKALRNFPITILLSMPTVVGRLCEELSVQGVDIEGIKSLRQVHCGGSYLTSNMRHRLQNGLGCDVFDFYGLSELFGPIAGECPIKDGMHLLSDYVYIEVLDPINRQPQPPGQPGVAVFTILWDKANPVIRYWSDDYVTIDSTPCVCGRTSPRLRFIGREIDSVQIPSGRLFYGDLEQQLLAFESVGFEFVCELLETRKGLRARLTVEELPGHEIPVSELRDRIEQLLSLKTHINLIRFGVLPRDTVKPRRIILHKE